MAICDWSIRKGNVDCTHKGLFDDQTLFGERTVCEQSPRRLCAHRHESFNDGRQKNMNRPNFYGRPNKI